MAKDVIRVLYKLPGCNPMECAVANTLETMQAMVGGYIETVTLAEDLVLICNEEGRFLPLSYNCTVCGTFFYGPVLFTGVDGAELTDCPMDIASARQLFPELWKEHM